MCRRLAGVDPVAHPAHEDGTSFGSVGKGDAGIVVNTFIHPQRVREVVGLKGFSVEFADEVLGDAAAVRAARVDADKEHPFLLAAIVELHQVRAFPDTVVGAVTRTEVTEEVPFFQVLGTVETDDLAAGEGHDPLVAYPVDLRVAEVPLVRIGEDRVAGEFVEGIAAVGGPGDALALSLAGGGVDGNDGILAEAGGILMVDHRAAGEDGSQFVRSDDRGGVFPVDQVFGNAQAPVHVAVGGPVRVVLEGKVPFAIDIDHAVRVVGPSEFRGEVHERTIGLIELVSVFVGSPDCAVNGVSGLDARKLHGDILAGVFLDVDGDVVFDIRCGRTGALGVSEDIDTVNFDGETGVGTGVGSRDQDVFLVRLEGHGVFFQKGAEFLATLLDLVHHDVAARHTAGTVVAGGGDIDLDGGLFTDQVLDIPGHPLKGGGDVADGRGGTYFLSIHNQADGVGRPTEAHGLRTAQKHVDKWFRDGERSGGQGTGYRIVIHALQIGASEETGCVSARSCPRKDFSFCRPVVQPLLEVFNHDTAATGNSQSRAKHACKKMI